MSNLKTLRMARGWRREDLASRTGLSLSTLNSLERDGAGRPATASTARVISLAFGIPEDEIWPPTPEPAPAAATSTVVDLGELLKGRK
jgi:transcriptional regulator with XRE-family HTH domain